MNTRHIAAVTVLLAAAVVPVADADTIYVDDDNCTGRYAAGNQPSSVAIGDMDGINGPDLVVASEYSEDVSVLLNQGAGTFAAAVAYDVGSRPKSVAIADLDGINGPDLAVAHSYSNGVSVLLSLGDGTFAPAVPYDVGDHPYSVAIGDLDGVNGPDLAVANYLSHDVSVLLNQGDGTFAAAVTYDPGSLPRSVAIGDLDGINGPDLAVANYASDDVSVLLNQGDGTFAAALAYVGGNGPWSVAIGDLDRINGPDLVVANYHSDDVSVLLNQGDGSFAPVVSYDAGDHLVSVAIGDLDGTDGPDLAVTSYVSGGVSVLLNQGDGSFAAAVVYAAGIEPVSVAIGDLDGTDGPDLAVANAGGDIVSVRPNPGDGTFEQGSGAAGDPYCFIQTAINNAVDTDEIVVAPGTYFESINFLGKAITVRSALGHDVTTIAARSSIRVVTCENGEGSDTVLQGFTITGGLSVIGGGMFNSGSSPTVLDCVFSRNTAWFPNGSLGGGMYNLDSNPTLIGCTFYANDTGGSFGSGGGGIYNRRSNPTIVNCLFSSHDSEGIRNHDGSSPTITNCTVVANLTGGIVTYWNSYPTITNSIIRDNAFAQVADDSTSGTTVNFSNVQGGWPGAGSNNIDADPLFVGVSTCCSFDLSRPGCDDRECEAVICGFLPSCCNSTWDPYCAYYAAFICPICPNDHRLQGGSPCIDAGHNNAIADLANTDLDGNARFADDPDTEDTGCGIPVIVDMGAYEYQGVPATVVFADLNGDGAVDDADLAIMIACLGSDDPDCCIADLNLDARVGIRDLLLIGSSGVEFSPVR